MTKKEGDLLRRLNIVLIWPTVVLFIVFVVSGYGTTNPGVTSELTGGLFTRTFSLYLHLNLATPLLLLLLIHVLIGARTALMRWGVGEGKLLNTFLIVVGLFAAFLIVLMQYLIL